MKSFYIFNISLILLLFVGLDAQEKHGGKWYTVESVGGNYKIDFPSSPIKTHIPNLDNIYDAELYSHDYSFLPVGINFTVKCLIFKDNRTPLERVELILKDFAVNYNDSTFYFKDSITNKNFANKGVEYTGIQKTSSLVLKKDVTGILKIFYTDNRVYIFDIVGDDDILNSGFPEKFINSFELLKKG